MCFYSSKQNSLTCDTEAALTNMKQVKDVVREDHQSLVTHVCEHDFKICNFFYWLLAFVKFYEYKTVCVFPFCFLVRSNEVYVWENQAGAHGDDGEAQGYPSSKGWHEVADGGSFHSEGGGKSWGAFIYLLL